MLYIAKHAFHPFGQPRSLAGGPEHLEGDKLIQLAHVVAGRIRQTRSRNDPVENNG
jgi:hypothetical protein